MNVRLAGRGDMAEVIRGASALLVELGGRALDPAQAGSVYAELLAKPELGFVFLAEEDGRASAVCTVSFVHALRAGGRYAIVQEMYVAPELRSTGLGARLLGAALAHARTAGCPFVELGTPLGGARQVAFYRRCGFVAVGERLRCVLG